MQPDTTKPKNQQYLTPVATANGLFGIILALFVALGLYYSIATPIFEAPDEVWHYAFIQHLAECKNLPVLDPAAPGSWAQEGGQPPLYYWLASQLTRQLLPANYHDLMVPNQHAELGTYRPDGNTSAFIHTPEEAWPWSGAALAIHLARWFSLLLAAGSVSAVWAIGRTIWPTHPLRAAAAAGLLAFNPMFLFISASVSNDNLATLIASLTLLALARLVRRETIAGWLAVGVLLGLGALSKISTLALAAPAIIVLGWCAWHKRSLACFLLRGLLLAGSALVIAGWWYWRNWQLYGDPLGLNAFVATIGPRMPAISLLELSAESQGFSRSFWGVFGWMNLVAPEWYYTLTLAIVIVAALGLVLAVARNLVGQGRRGARNWLLIAVGLVWPAAVFAGLVRWTMITPASQGRLLFPAANALALATAYGLEQLLPGRWRHLPQAAAVLLLLGLAIWVPSGVIAPAYRAPAALSETQLPASMQAVGTSYEGRVRLLGYELAASSAAPGGIVSVTLYWQLERPEREPLSAYVQLVDAGGQVVAQRDKLLGDALLDTRQWQPGEIYAQRYDIFLPADTLNPSQLELIAGLYQRHSDSRRLKTVRDGATIGEVQSLAMMVSISGPGVDGIANPMQITLGDDLDLLGFTLGSDRYAPGDSLSITLYWRSRAPIAQDYVFFTQLLDASNGVIAQWHGQPQDNTAPTSTWVAGRIVANTVQLQIDPAAARGGYRLDVGAYPAAGGENLLFGDGENHLVLGWLRIE